MVIRRVGPLSCAKIVGALYVVLGFFFGAMFSMAGMAGAMGGDAENPFGMIFGGAAIIVMPVLYGCMGFLGALIGATLYNAMAGAIGGIQLELE